MQIISLIIVLIALFFLIRFIRTLKILNVGSMVLITGGVKAGKSTYAVATAINEVKKRKRAVVIDRIVWWYKWILKIPMEKIYLFSNVPLGIPYVPLTKDILLRNKRLPSNCVVYVCEASLVADSQLIRNENANIQLTLFNKLIAHSTHGGCLIYDTQSIADVHYSIKRCLSNYVYIESTRKVPLMPLLIVKARQLVYSDDSSTVNVFNDDLEASMRTMIIPSKTWKYFDCYCYSSFTDDKELCDCDEVVTDNLKVDNNSLLSFRDYSKFVGGKNGDR